MSVKSLSRALPVMLAALTGCTLIPTYHRPALPVSATYPTGEAYKPTPGAMQSKVSASDLGWQDFYLDPRLRALIAIAIRENRDIMSAAASIEQAQGQAELQHAQIFPLIGVNGQGLYEAPSTHGGFSFAPTSGNSISTFRYYTAGLGFSSYEIDLFGRIRSLSREEEELALSQVESARSVLITTISQVANAYIAWLADRELLRVTEQTLVSQQETLRLTQLSFDHGSTDLLTLRQIETQVRSAAANRALYERNMAQDENTIVMLIGAPIPANLPAPMPFGSQTVTIDLPAGLPSDLLERRPDVLSAEHALLSANADIGAARANFFPKITLTANEGVSSRQFRNLMTAGSQTWLLEPEISIPLLSWGQNEGNLRTSKAKKVAEIRAYEKAIQSAFEEVSNALASRSTYMEQAKQLQEDVNASADAYRLAMMRFKAGSDSYLTTLDSQRTLYQAQQNLISVQAAKYENLVTFYRVLGGGWKQTTAPVAKPA